VKLWTMSLGPLTEIIDGDVATNDVGHYAQLFFGNVALRPSVRRSCVSVTLCSVSYCMAHTQERKKVMSRGQALARTRRSDRIRNRNLYHFEEVREVMRTHNSQTSESMPYIDDHVLNCTNRRCAIPALRACRPSALRRPSRTD